LSSFNIFNLDGVWSSLTKEMYFMCQGNKVKILLKLTDRKPPAPHGEPSDISNSLAHRQSEDYVRVVVSP
jgi:hypothetical protein